MKYLFHYFFTSFILNTFLLLPADVFAGGRDGATGGAGGCVVPPEGSWVVTAGGGRVGVTGGGGVVAPGGGGVLAEGGGTVLSPGTVVRGWVGAVVVGTGAAVVGMGAAVVAEAAVTNILQINDRKKGRK